MQFTQQDLDEFKRRVGEPNYTQNDVLRWETLSCSLEVVLSERDKTAYVAAVSALKDDIMACEQMAIMIVNRIEKKILASPLQMIDGPYPKKKADAEEKTNLNGSREVTCIKFDEVD